MLIEIKKIPRCLNCSADDNLVSDQKYILNAETLFRNHYGRIWLWDCEKDIGYFTEPIHKVYKNVYLSYNAKYIIKFYKNVN